MDRVNIPADEKIAEMFLRFGAERKNTMSKNKAVMDNETTEPQARNYEILETKEVNVDLLKPHPRNEEIYGRDEDVRDLIGLIRESGEIDKLIINPNHVIISGHRRWLAARKLAADEQMDFKTLLCEIRKYSSPEAEIEALITANIGRDKTNEQKTREGMDLEKIISARSIERKKSTLKQNQTDMGETPTSDEKHKGDEKGDTRDIVARAVKISSGTKYERSKTVVKRADEYKSARQDIDSDVLISILNKSPSAAHEILAVIDSLSDEQKESLIDGTAKPSKFIPQKAKKPKMKTKSTYGLYKKQMVTIKNAIKELKKLDLKGEVSANESKAVQSDIDEQVESLRSLLPHIYLPNLD